MRRPPLPNLPGLPDLIVPGLRLLFVGYNPSIPAAKLGHYYANPVNHFYRLLAESGVTPRLLAPAEDGLLPSFGIGCTDLCPTPTAQAGHLPPGMLRAGRETLRAKIEQFAPAWVCFNGLGVFKAFWGYPPQDMGPQAEVIGVSRVFVTPSTSPANNGLMAQRAAAFHLLATTVFPERVGAATAVSEAP